jgi:hypothetical protein
MGNAGMAQCCSVFVLSCSAPASAGVPQGPCPKALWFELNTRAHAPISAAASGQTIRPLAGSIRKPLRRIENTPIHANHLEALNASLRRRCAAYRRKTTTYAKKKKRLKPSLDIYWILHNFVRVHFTTQHVPAVALSIIEQGLSLAEIFSYSHAFGIERNQCPS